MKVSFSRLLPALKSVLVKQLVRRIYLHPSLPNYAISDINTHILRYLDIAESGVDGDVPWVRLAGGPIFFGKPSTLPQRRLYGTKRDLLPKRLTEDCMGVALDVVQRFFMENGYFGNLPRSCYTKFGGAHLDVGAYIGYGAMRSSLKLGPPGRVIAIEIDADNFELMERNFKENGMENVVSYNCAVGDAEGTIDYLDTGRQVNSIRSDLSALRGKSAVVKSATCRTLDAIIAECGVQIENTPLFASLEINGAEPMALRGAVRILSKAADLAIRIAAPYTIRQGAVREEVLRALEPYNDLQVFDVPPQIVVYRNVAH